MSLVNRSADAAVEKSCGCAWSLDVPNWMAVFNQRKSACSESAITFLVEDLDFIQASWEMYFRRRKESLKCYLNPEKFLAELPEIAKLPCPKRFFIDCDIGPGHERAGPRLARAVRDACPDSQIFLETSYARSDFSEELKSGILDEVYKKIPNQIFEPDLNRKDGSGEFLDIHPVRVTPKEIPKLPENPPEAVVKTVVTGVAETSPLKNMSVQHRLDRTMTLGFPPLIAFFGLAIVLLKILDQLPFKWQQREFFLIGSYPFHLGDLLAVIAMNIALLAERKIISPKWIKFLKSETATDRVCAELQRLRALGSGAVYTSQPHKRSLIRLISLPAVVNAGLFIIIFKFSGKTG